MQWPQPSIWQLGLPKLWRRLAAAAAQPASGQLIIMKAACIGGVAASTGQRLAKA